MKKSVLFISVFMLMILTACTGDEFQPKDMIRKPENNISPIKGKWFIEKTIDGPYKVDVKRQVNTEIEALFHRDGVVVGKDFVLEPSYKIRNIKLDDYLFYSYKVNSDYLDIKEEEAEVITILGEGQYFYEFIRYSEDQMFYYKDDEFVFLKQKVQEVSSEEINRYISIEKNIMRISNKKEIDTLNSGLLLGIKTNYIDEDSSREKWDYKTIWIKSNNRSLGDLYKIDGLLVPRKKGFYSVDVKREENNNNINDTIEVRSKVKSQEDLLLASDVSIYSEEEEKNTVKESSLMKHIIYIGNDYVSTEEIDLETKEKNLRVYPVDYVEDNKPVKISNLIGGKNLELFYESAKDTMKGDINYSLEEESFAFERRNGSWVMKGRVNYNGEDINHFKDFPIKTKLPEELVYYDELTIPWNVIKAKIPGALDAFSSPNEDIIVIITRNDILIYPIIDKELILDELGRIKLNNQDKIIMAEWGTGQYTSLWEEEVLKNQAEKIENK